MWTETTFRNSTATPIKAVVYNRQLGYKKNILYNKVLSLVEPRQEPYVLLIKRPRRCGSVSVPNHKNLDFFTFQLFCNCTETFHLYQNTSEARTCILLCSICNLLLNLCIFIKQAAFGRSRILWYLRMQKICVTRIESLVLQLNKIAEMSEMPTLYNVHNGKCYSCWVGMQTRWFCIYFSFFWINEWIH